jgi:excisionase family DNA binding protein
MATTNELPNRWLFTPEEVAELLRVTRRTVYTWLRTERLPGTKQGRWVVQRADLVAFIQGTAAKSAKVVRRRKRRGRRQ